MSESLVAEDMTSFENIDMVLTIRFRALGGLTTEGLRKLYWASRQKEPISYSISNALESLPHGSRIGIITGSLAPHFPGGENDGPLGTAVLANALQRMDFRVKILSESPILDVLDAFSVVLETNFEFRELHIESEDVHSNLAQEFDICIAIEKAGVNSAGVLHASTSGESRDGTRAKVDSLILELERQSKLTIGVGDGGNEIGFGKIYEAARDVFPYGKACNCPCGMGIVTTTSTRLFYPVSISNWGAYGIAAGLAILSRDSNMLHSPNKELEMLELAARLDCRDGSTGKATVSVDGVNGETSAAVVQILREIIGTSI